LEAARQTGDRISFSFGANWAKYLGELTDERIASAQLSLQASFGLDSFAGRSFLDVGCGSGLFSLCASRLGARRVVSFDVDPNSVRCAEILREREGNPDSWSVMRGSVLDHDFLAEIPRAGLVFSWGVLHHTGSMWRAVENVFSLVEPGGLLCLALYNVPRYLPLILFCKHAYNRAPGLTKPFLVGAYGSATLLLEYRHSRTLPWDYIRDYGKAAGRGMSFWRDQEDWLGGLPYEVASADEVRRYAEARGMKAERLLVRGPRANNEYLLSRP